MDRRARLHPLATLLSTLLVAILVLGCRPKTKVLPSTYYAGPTETIEAVTAQVNANNRAIPSLWSRHDFEATIIDEQGREHYVNGDGTLMYRRPYDVRIEGSKPVVGRVFEIGANEENYWLLVPVEMKAMWWGQFRHLGKPCVQQMPIRPDLLLEVLGISEFNPDLLAQPAPVMRFNNDRDAYMFVWVYEGSGKLIAQKEVWYDRKNKLPVLVALFDPNGRIVLRAYLSDHQPIRVAGKPEAEWPRVATRYELFFPENKSRMTLTLRDPVLSRNGFPKPGGIQLPQSPGIPAQNVIQVDENCGD